MKKAVELEEFYFVKTNELFGVFDNRFVFDCKSN